MVNPALHPAGVAKSSTVFAGVKAGMLPVPWQVTLGTAVGEKAHHS